MKKTKSISIKELIINYAIIIVIIVKQKERITSLKTSMDILTLSATPIPHTLYLSLIGFHDAR
jgi:hypothetical protein